MKSGFVWLDNLIICWRVRNNSGFTEPGRKFQTQSLMAAEGFNQVEVHNLSLGQIRSIGISNGFKTMRTNPGRLKNNLTALLALGLILTIPTLVSFKPLSLNLAP